MQKTVCRYQNRIGLFSRQLMHASPHPRSHIQAGHATFSIAVHGSSSCSDQCFPFFPFFLLRLAAAFDCPVLHKCV